MADAASSDAQPDPTASVMALLQELETEHPVASWTIDDVHVWPLIRAHLAWFLNADFASMRAAAEADHVVRRRLHRIADLGVGIGRSVALTLRDRSHEASLREHADAVLLGDNVSRIHVDGVWYDRLCEPFMATLGSIGRSSLHLEPYHRYPHPRSSPSRHIQATVDALWLRSRLPSRRPFNLPGFAAMEASLRERGMWTEQAGLTSLRRTFEHVQLVAGYFRRIFRRVRPRIGLFVDFSVVSCAFALACKQHGIPSVEIQHGVRHPAHWAYAGWTDVPVGGYEVLPDLYWCWSQNDAGIIEAWAQGTEHRPVVGGDLWLRAWRSGTVAGPSEKAMPVAGDVTVLWTLQPSLADADHLKLLRSAVAAAPPSWSWWVRLHPTMGDAEARQVRAWLQDLDRVDIERATQVPLLALLQRATVHVTHSSAAVIEAAAFNVPSVVVSDVGARLFDERDTVVLATDGQAIVAAVERLRSRPRAAADEIDVGPAALLRDLLGEVSR